MPAFSKTTSGSGRAGSVPGPPDDGWTPQERAALVAVARAALTAAAWGTPLVEPHADVPPRLTVPAGTFVTLYRGKDLRGCIGSVEPQGPLATLVAHMATAAATRDPRFAPLAPEELDGLRVEISVLSPTHAVAADDVDPATHGVCISHAGRHAVFLPQVAVRHGWDRETLLAELCTKADLPPDAWRDASVVLRVFTVVTIEGEL
jgi:AmmeMemoRadiSam system protein A